MLISSDVKGLEVVTAAWLANDDVLRWEIINGVDIHANNQATFNLPDRLTAKRFKFKLLYGGTAPGFVNDPDLKITKFSKKRWQQVIDDYYSKYKGIAQWHADIINEVLLTGFLETPSGRVYDYRELLSEPDWYYLPKIKNYPVQGFGADIVKIARISLKNRWKKEYGLLCNTIHDSIIVDTPSDMVYNISNEIKKVFEDLPKNLSNMYKINWDLPIGVEFKQLNGKPI